MNSETIASDLVRASRTRQTWADLDRSSLLRNWQNAGQYITSDLCRKVDKVHGALLQHWSLSQLCCLMYFQSAQHTSVRGSGVDIGRRSALDGLKAKAWVRVERDAMGRMWAQVRKTRFKL